MDAIHGGCRTGKTTELMRAWDYSRSCLLVMSNQERLRIIQDYKLQPDEARRVFSTSGNFDKLRGIDGHLLVDNADIILSKLLGRQVDLITFTGGAKQIRPIIDNFKGITPT